MILFLIIMTVIFGAAHLTAGILASVQPADQAKPSKASRIVVNFVFVGYFALVLLTLMGVFRI